MACGGLHPVKAIVDQLTTQGVVVRPYLGIRWERLTPNVAAANGPDVSYGAYITEVTPRIAQRQTPAFARETSLSAWTGRRSVRRTPS